MIKLKLPVRVSLYLLSVASVCIPYAINSNSLAKALPHIVQSTVFNNFIGIILVIGSRASFLRQRRVLIFCLSAFFLLSAIVPIQATADVPTAPQLPGNASEFLLIEREPIRLQHVLYLSPVPGLPARIIIERLPARAERVRMLILLDGRMFFREAKGAGENWVVEFPTPVRSLGYRFQVEYRDKQVVLSSPYRAALKCKINSTETGADDFFPSARDRLLYRARTIGIEEEVYSNLLEVIKQVLDSGQSEGRE